MLENRSCLDVKDARFNKNDDYQVSDTSTTHQRQTECEWYTI